MERYQGIDDIQRDKILKEFKNLEDIEDIYLKSIKKYNRYRNFLNYPLIVSVIIFIICINLKVIYFSDPMLIIFIAYFFLFPSNMYLMNKKLKFKLKNHDLIFLETFSAIINLDKYMNNIGLDTYKKSAMENIEKIIKLVNTWEYGNLKITKSLVGKRIDLLKENLINKPLGYINDEKIHVISHLINTSIEFLIYLLNPSIEQIDKINSMFDLYSYSKYKTPSKFDSAKNYLYYRPNLIRFISALFVSASFYLIGIYRVKINFENIYAHTALIFISVFLGIDRILSLDKKNSKLE